MNRFKIEKTPDGRYEAWDSYTPRSKVFDTEEEAERWCDDQDDFSWLESE